MAITFYHAAQIFNFPKNLIPGPVHDALININKRNVTLDLMDMFKAEIEQNKIAKEEKLREKLEKENIGKPSKNRRPSEYRDG